MATLDSDDLTAIAGVIDARLAAFGNFPADLRKWVGQDPMSLVIEAGSSWLPVLVSRSDIVLDANLVTWKGDIPTSLIGSQVSSYTADIDLTALGRFLNNSGGFTTGDAVAGSLGQVLADLVAAGSSDGDILTALADVQTRLPAALVDGRMDSSVGGFSIGVFDDTAFTLPDVDDQPATGLVGMVQQLWRRWLAHVEKDKDAGTITMFADDEITRLITQDFTSDTSLDVLGAARSVFTPASIASVSLWLDPNRGRWKDTAGTVPANDTDDLVARWDDQSGHGYNGTQATSGDRPSFKLASVGANSIKGDQNGGISAVDGKFLSVGTGPNVAAAGALTCFAVLRVATADINRGGAWVIAQEDDSGQGFALGICNFGGVLSIQSDFAGTGLQGATNVTADEWHIFEWWNTTAGAIKHVIDGVSINDYGPGTRSVGASAATPTLVLQRGEVTGGGHGSPEPYYGEIGDLVLYGTSLSDDDRGKVRAFLARKYGITL